MKLDQIHSNLIAMIKAVNDTLQILSMRRVSGSEIRYSQDYINITKAYKDSYFWVAGQNRTVILKVIKTGENAEESTTFNI